MRTWWVVPRLGPGGSRHDMQAWGVPLDQLAGWLLDHCWEANTGGVAPSRMTVVGRLVLLWVAPVARLLLWRGLVWTKSCSMALGGWSCTIVRSGTEVGGTPLRNAPY